MAVVLAAFDDSMKEVLALVNKTAYNITLACMSCVAYSLSWQLHTCRCCLIQRFTRPKARAYCLVLRSSGNMQTIGHALVAMQTDSRKMKQSPSQGGREEK